MSFKPRRTMSKSDYSAYLRSPHWKNTRYWILRERDKCEICAKVPKWFEVHHKSYRNIWRERAEDLMVLCPECHDLMHGEAANDPQYEMPEDIMLTESMR